MWDSFLCLNEQAVAELRLWKENVQSFNGQRMWFASSAVRVAYSDGVGLAMGGIGGGACKQCCPWYVVRGRVNALHGESWKLFEEFWNRLPP